MTAKENHVSIKKKMAGNIWCNWLNTELGCPLLTKDNIIIFR